MVYLYNLTKKKSRNERAVLATFECLGEEKPELTGIE
jgi:hypothetical protein